MKTDDRLCMQFALAAIVTLLMACTGCGTIRTARSFLREVTGQPPLPPRSGEAEDQVNTDGDDTGAPAVDDAMNGGDATVDVAAADESEPTDPSPAESPSEAPAASNEKAADASAAWTPPSDAVPIATEKREDGLVIEILREAEEEDAPTCEANSLITVQYRGELADGTVFDATSATGGSVGPWPLDQLIDGWQQGLIGAEVGEIRRLTIPPALAYGEQALTDSETGAEIIPANATLTFTIELVDIQRSE